MSEAIVLGCRVDRLSLDETVDRCLERIKAGDLTVQVSVNAAKLVAMRDDRRLKAAVDAADIRSADGQSVVLASRWLGPARIPERVAGIDLMQRLLAAAAEQDLRIFLLGAKREVLEQARARLLEQHPTLTIAGYRDGYFADTDLDDVCDEIRRAHPHLLFVAMSSPRKEYFLADRADGLGVPFSMGVGGAIDVIAGVTKRAPRVAQRMGLEWLYRVGQEPRRLWRRYAITNTIFVWLVAREIVATRLGRRTRKSID